MVYKTHIKYTWCTKTHIISIHMVNFQQKISL